MNFTTSQLGLPQHIGESTVKFSARCLCGAPRCYHSRAGVDRRFRTTIPEQFSICATVAERTRPGREFDPSRISTAEQIRAHGS